MLDSQRDILAVQTLGHWRTAASFLAKTAILIACGALHCLTTIPEQPQRLHELDFLGSTSPTMLTLKLFAIVATLLIAFLNFAAAVRAAVVALGECCIVHRPVRDGLP